ncbi:MAG: hypothetical protein ACRD0C_03000 [Acidimicrobiia bacterium]
MTKDTTSWHHAPFGRRVMIPGHPYFVMTSPTDPTGRDAAARRALADLAGL